MISVVFVISLLSGGAASAAYASDNADVYDNYESICESQLADQYDVLEDACNDIIRIRDSEAAAAVSYKPCYQPSSYVLKSIKILIESNIITRCI